MAAVRREQRVEQDGPQRRPNSAAAFEVGARRLLHHRFRRLPQEVAAQLAADKARRRRMRRQALQDRLGVPLPTVRSDGEVEEWDIFTPVIMESRQVGELPARKAGCYGPAGEAAGDRLDVALRVAALHP